MFKRSTSPSLHSAPGQGTLQPADQPLDCSRAKNFLCWFVAGAAMVLLLQSLAVYTHGEGAWAWLIHVAPEAKDRPLREFIEGELGDVGPLLPNGHDGRFFYAIARDPFGIESAPELVDDARYRYQRILYPLVGGGGGLLGPQATLIGLVVWSLLGAGLLVVGTADLTFQLGLQRWVVLLTLFNLGLFYSAVTLTADILAAGLAIAGLALWGRGKLGAAITLFALAALSREVNLLVPWSLALMLWLEGSRRWAVGVAVISAAPAIVWRLWLSVWMPTVNGGSHNFDVPGVGLLQSAALWLRGDSLVGSEDLYLGGLTVAMMGVATVMACMSKNTLLRWQSVGWVCLGLMTSIQVWGKANNMLRLFVLLWIFMILNVCWHFARSSVATAAAPET